MPAKTITEYQRFKQATPQRRADGPSPWGLRVGWSPDQVEAFKRAYALQRKAMLEEVARLRR